MRIPSFLAFIVLIFVSCAENESPSEICSLVNEDKILTEEERDASCNYLNIYLFKGRIYQTCVCCLCNKISNPIDCDGNPLCTGHVQDCINDFFEKAEYLFSMAE